VASVQIVYHTSQEGNKRPELLRAFLDAALVVTAFGPITTNLLSNVGVHLVTLGLRLANKPEDCAQ
jgi:flagellar basal body-associated protein FliL